MIWMQAEARKADSMSTNSVTTITIVISRRRLWPYRLWEVICITIAPQTPHVKNTSRAAITHTYTFSVLLAIHHLQVIFTAPPRMNSCLSIISIFFSGWAYFSSSTNHSHSGWFKRRENLFDCGKLLKRCNLFRNDYLLRIDNSYLLRSVLVSESETSNILNKNPVIGNHRREKWILSRRFSPNAQQMITDSFYSILYKIGTTKKFNNESWRPIKFYFQYWKFGLYGSD